MTSFCALVTHLMIFSTFPFPYINYFDKLPHGKPCQLDKNCLEIVSKKKTNRKNIFISVEEDDNID